MSRNHAHAILALAAILLTASGAFAVHFLIADPTRSGTDAIYTSKPRETPALADSVRLIGPRGSDAPFNGQFQDLSGSAPAWNGWTHADATAPDGSAWHISDYMAADLEPGYDFVDFNFLTAQGSLNMAHVDGQGTAVTFEHQHAYTTSDYLGPDGDEVIFEILVTTDGGFSDADCQYPSQGACQVDNLRVVCDNGGLDELADFQDGPGGWETYAQLGAGDFTQIWNYLEDIDLCQTNYSPQVAFIDDGLVVPGVGPSECITWCYGPGG